jgi:hypothetical protein
VIVEPHPRVIPYLAAGCAPLWWSSDSGLKNKQLKRKEKNEWSKQISYKNLTTEVNQWNKLETTKSP